MSTIYIAKKLFPLFAKGLTDGSRRALVTELELQAVFGSKVVQQALRWGDFLDSQNQYLDNHPDGHTTAAVCQVSHLPTECEICNLWGIEAVAAPEAEPKTTNLWLKYKGELVAFRGQDYADIAEAEQSGAVYRTTSTLDAVENCTALRDMLQALDTLDECGGLEGIQYGFICNDRTFMHIRDLVTAADGHGCRPIEVLDGTIYHNHIEP